MKYKHKIPIIATGCVLAAFTGPQAGPYRLCNCRGDHWSSVWVQGKIGGQQVTHAIASPGEKLSSGSETEEECG